MSDISIKPIGGVLATDVNTLAKAQTTEQAHQRVQAAKAQVEDQTRVNEMRSLNNVSIQFRVDDTTKDVTVFLVDRKSRKVLRSIPAAELSKLQISDLLKMTV